MANTCVKALDLKIPCLIDQIENGAARAYKGWPDRLYLVGKNGKIAYRGGPGPFGFKPDELKEAIEAELKQNAEG